MKRLTCQASFITVVFLQCRLPGSAELSLLPSERPGLALGRLDLLAVV